LGNKDRDGSGNKERRNQAGQHMLSRILLKHHEGFKSGLPDGGIIPGNVIGTGKSGNNEQKLRSFFQLRISFYRYISIRQYIE
jgi:hypothetical protein